MEHEKPHQSPSTRERERYYDDSDDLAARVRRAKEAAQRQLEAFGDRSEYEVRIIQGRRTDIDYSQPPKPEEGAVVPAAPEAAVAPSGPSQRDLRKNAAEQGSLEFGSAVASEES